MKKVAILGGGSWGTSLANVLADNGHQVLIYMRDEIASDTFNKSHMLKKYLGDIRFNASIKSTTNIDDLDEYGIIIFAVPTQAVRSVVEANKDLFSDKVIVNVAKGIEIKTGKMISQIFSEFYDENNFVCLSGPSHAEEVALRMPTTIVSSSTSVENMEMVQDIFMNDYFRVYTNPDIKGVEIGGATKNILSLGIGIIDGLGFGDNAKAAVLTRGIHEIARLGLELGAKQETFYGLTGIGDLIATSTSPHSRNRQAGILIGKGHSLEETEKMVGMVVEGIKTTQAVYELKERLNIDMPITDEIYNVIYKGHDVKDSYKNLMLRDRKEEKY